MVTRDTQLTCGKFGHNNGVLKDINVSNALANANLTPTRGREQTNIPVLRTQRTPSARSAIPDTRKIKLAITRPAHESRDMQHLQLRPFHKAPHVFIHRSN